MGVEAEISVAGLQPMHLPDAVREWEQVPGADRLRHPQPELGDQERYGQPREQDTGPC